MILRACAVGLALATGVAGVALAVRPPWPPGEPAAPAASVLALAAAAPAVTCPGPETSVAPAGSSPQPAAGVVTLTAVAAGPGAGLTALASLASLATDGADGADGAALSAGTDLHVLERIGGVSAPLRLSGATGAANSRQAAVQTTFTRAGDRRGLAAVACPAATTDAWLVGGATSAGHRARLILLDPTPAAAVVDVVVLGPKGPVDLPSARGLVVAPGRARALQLDALAPGLDRLAVHVVARRGRVAAVLDDSRLDGATPAGVDDVPVAAAPSRHLTLPAVALPLAPAGGSASATVRLAVPGPDDAVVHLHLSGTGGDLPLPRAGVVTVPAGTVTDVPLAVVGGAYAVRVDADVPVLAGAQVRLAGRPAGPLRRSPADVAWTAASAPLAGDAVLALPVPAEGSGPGAAPVPAAAQLVLTAGDAAADVVVRRRGARGEPLATSTVHVGARTTVVLPVTGAAALGLTLPRGGRVTAGAAVVVADPAGPLVTLVPLGPPAAAGHDRLVAVPDPWLPLQSSQSSSLP